MLFDCIVMPRICIREHCFIIEIGDEHCYAEVEPLLGELYNLHMFDANPQFAPKLIDVC